MDLKEFGIEELTHKEATDIDGGFIIGGILAAITNLPLLFGGLTIPLYIAAILAGLAVPVV